MQPLIRDPSFSLFMSKTMNIQVVSQLPSLILPSSTWRRRWLGRFTCCLLSLHRIIEKQKVSVFSQCGRFESAEIH